MKLRFSIRDLLWLTLVAAVLTAWWIDRTRLSSELDGLRPKPPVAGQPVAPPY